LLPAFLAALALAGARGDEPKPALLKDLELFEAKEWDQAAKEAHER
jgi:hypothetical protein